MGKSGDGRNGTGEDDGWIMDKKRKGNRGWCLEQEKIGVGVKDEKRWGMKFRTRADGELFLRNE